MDKNNEALLVDARAQLSKKNQIVKTRDDKIEDMTIQIENLNKRIKTMRDTAQGKKGAQPENPPKVRPGTK